MPRVLGSPVLELTIQMMPPPSWFDINDQYASGRGRIINFGWWTGCSFAEVMERYPVDLACNVERWRNLPPAGTNARELVRWYDEIWGSSAGAPRARSRSPEESRSSSSAGVPRARRGRVSQASRGGPEPEKSRTIVFGYIPGRRKDPDLVDRARIVEFGPFRNCTYAELQDQGGRYLDELDAEVRDGTHDGNGGAPEVKRFVDWWRRCTGRTHLPIAWYSPMFSHESRYVAEQLPLLFGKHRGMTYWDAAYNDPSYGRWAVAETDPSEELRFFAQWFSSSPLRDAAAPAALRRGRPPTTQSQMD
jgi:hypothetical protein